MADPGNLAVDLFSPSGAAVSQNTDSGNFSPLVRSIAVNDSTQYSYVADSAADAVDVFDNTGAFVTQWNGSSTPSGSFGDGFVFAAVDNSADAASGDVYVTDSGDRVIDKLNPNGNPVAFSGSASYISGSQLTGTPDGPFQNLQGITVDAQGNIYAIEQGAGVVDEFDDTGKFVQQFTGAGTPQGPFSNITGVGVDPVSGNVYVVDQGNDVVDEFSSSGSYVAQLTGAGTPTGSFSDPQGVAVDGSGDVYVSDAGNQVVDEFGPDVLVPDVQTTEATNLNSGSATLSGTVNPDGTTITDCHFEYVDDADYNPSSADPYSAGGTVPCTSTPSGSTPQPVSADVSGLSPLTEYDYRLVASDNQGSGYGGDQTFYTPEAPLVDGESVSDVGTGTATLTGQINPQYADTTYHFEYGSAGPCSSNACTSVPVPDGDIGAGDSDVTISQSLSGLSSGTRYFYRVVASNSVGSIDGGDQSFETQSSPSGSGGSCPNAQFRYGYGTDLPDCRAYEQVTPVNKDGTNPEGVGLGGDWSQAATDGNGITFLTNSGMPGGTGAQSYPIYLASRSSTGWSTRGLYPPASVGNRAQVFGWSPDLSWSLDYAQDTSASSGTVYLQDDSSGALTPISAAVPLGAVPGGLQTIVTTAAGPEAVFEYQASLTSDAAPSSVNDYAWSNGTLRLVSVLPDGTAATEGPANYGRGAQVDATTGSGSGILFTATADTGEDRYTNQIFLRENPLASDASTVEVSASQATNPDPNGPQSPTYLGATPSGSEVFFMSSEELTDDADTGSSDQGSDLYAYDVATGTLSDLSLPDPGTTNPDGNGAEVQGLLGTSQDGSYVYFVANGVLATNTGADGSTASQGNCQGGGLCNVYLWHDGTVTYITQLNGNTDTGDWNAPVDPINGTAGVYEPLESQVAPDGQTLLFSSAQPLTGYDNTDAGGNQDQELYVYKATSGHLGCVSCDPTGAPPIGSAVEAPQTTTSASPAGVAAFQTRNLSSSGDQVFFDSPDPLLPQDTNGQLNVYEWEADGAGSCQSSGYAGGCLYSISTGQSSQPDYFADASADGSNVFFFTYSQLVGQDQDQIEDIYDARVDGGLASQNPSPPTSCTASDCRQSSSPPPATSPPGSVTFYGPGDQSGKTSHKAPKVEVTRRTIHGTRLVIKVSVPTAGRITASGSEVRTARRQAHRAGSYRLTLRLTGRARRQLEKRGAVRVRIRVSYDTGQSRTTASVSLTAKAR